MRRRDNGRRAMDRFRRALKMPDIPRGAVGRVRLAVGGRVPRGAAPEGGFSSVAGITLLLFLAAAAAGGILILRAALSYDRRSEDGYAARQALRKEAERIIQELADDPTPEADSPVDPVWNAVKAPALEGATIDLKDVSSALNPNWVQKNVFQKTDMESFFQPGRTPDELQQRREDKGFFLDIKAAYGDLLLEEALDKYFTGYGWSNINVTDEFALRKLYELRTGDEQGSEAFHARIQQRLMEKKLITADELGTFLGAAYQKIYPVMNAEPEMNVHFVDEKILGDLLSYPDLKIPHPEQTARLIVETRGTSELTASELTRIIGVAAENRIYQYFGVTTWFWKITVEKPPARLELVAARFPAKKDERARFQIVEERYGR